MDGSGHADALRLEVDRLKWQHEMELAEMRHNNELTIAEIRQSLENEKKSAIDEIRKRLEKEKAEAIRKSLPNPILARGTGIILKIGYNYRTRYNSKTLFQNSVITLNEIPVFD